MVPTGTDQMAQRFGQVVPTGTDQMAQRFGQVIPMGSDQTATVNRFADFTQPKPERIAPTVKPMMSNEASLTLLRDKKRKILLKLCYAMACASAGQDVRIVDAATEIVDNVGALRLIDSVGLDNIFDALGRTYQQTADPNFKPPVNLQKLIFRNASQGPRIDFKFHKDGFSETRITPNVREVIALLKDQSIF